MYRTLVSLGVLSSLSAVSAAMAATCMAVTQGSVTVDGVVVPRPGIAAAPGCPAAAPDRGWGGVVGEALVVQPRRAHGLQQGTLFVTAQEEGGRVKRIYLGLRILNAPDFTNNDRFTLYFHAAAAVANWDPTNDFALAFGGIGPQAATPLGQDGCANVGSQPLFYKRDAGNTTWVPQKAFPAGISFRTSFDYETAHDPQTETWQLEVAVDLSILDPNLAIARDGQIGFGSKLYLFDTGVSSTTPLYFPAHVAPDDPFLDFHPNQGGVTPATLEKLAIGGCPGDVVVLDVDITSPRGTDGTFTFVQPDDFDSAGNLPSSKQSLLQATLRFVNPANPLDARPLAMPNQGTVKFMSDGQFSPSALPPGQPFSFPLDSTSASFTRLGETVKVAIPWPSKRDEYINCCAVQLMFSFERRLRVQITDFNVDQNTHNEAAQPFVLGR